MRSTLLIEGNCANSLYLRQNNLLSVRLAAKLDEILGAYARRRCYGVGFGQSNIIKALWTLQVDVINDFRGEARYLNGGEQSLLDQTIRVAECSPEVVRALEDYRFERNGAPKAPATILLEIMRLLVLMRTLSADLWMWSPRLRIVEAVFRSSGSPLTVEEAADGVRVHRGRVADFPYLPPLRKEANTDFTFLEFDPISASPKTTKRNVLFIASAPRNLVPTRFDVELRNIQREVENADPGLVCRPELAVRPQDVERALLDMQHIVHFAGHATAAGLQLQDDAGYAKEMSYEWFAGVVSTAGPVECILLNACHSENGAAALAKVSKYVIAIPDKWDDDGGVEFAHAFYLLIARGTAIPHAFRVARNRVADLGVVPDASLPILFEHGARKAL